MPKIAPWLVIAFVLGSALILAAACSGDGEGNKEPPSPTTAPTPTSNPTTTPEPTATAKEHLLGVFVVRTDGSGEPVKVADDGFVAGWSPDGTLVAVSTLDPDQSGCNGVVPALCFRELSVVRADGQGEAVDLGDAQWATWSARENKLLFYRFARPKGTIVSTEIIVADATTGQTTTLASVGPELSAGPRWSPDESHILFGFGSGVYVVPADGSQAPVRLADGNALESDWSPDGRNIVYSWGGEIYTVAADGSGSPRHFVIGHRPYWSPDGSRIVYVARTLPTAEIWLLDPVTGESEKLVDGDLPYGPSEPVWSPDGSLLLYNRSGAIYSLELGGDAPPNKLADGWFPDWSPDGKRLAFTRGFDRDDGAPIKSQLFAVDADGSGLTLLADNLTRACVTFAWSADGQRIAFSSFYCPLL
jgi:TolB protein